MPEELLTVVALSHLEIRENTGALAPPRESAEAPTSRAAPEKLLVAVPTSCKSNDLLEQRRHRSLSSTQRCSVHSHEGATVPTPCQSENTGTLLHPENLQRLLSAKQHKQHQKNCRWQQQVTCLSRENTGRHRHLSSAQRICRGLRQRGSTHSHEKAAGAHSLLIRENTGTLAPPRESAGVHTSRAAPEKLLVSVPMFTRGLPVPTF